MIDPDGRIGVVGDLIEAIDRRLDMTIDDEDLSDLIDPIDGSHGPLMRKEVPPKFECGPLERCVFRRRLVVMLLQEKRLSPLTMPVQLRGVSLNWRIVVLASLLH